SSISSAPSSDFRRFFRRGAASTSSPPSLSTARFQLSSPLPVRLLPSGLFSVGRGFYLSAALAVNSLVDCPIFLSALHLS
ncbi:hypothetical protein, partial [Corallococcus llansteffanensis]|uniref:hypothetical protein n=1 Tax=Corallococcus llansteffanensis TaxID=2316731 RepID=UPI001ABEED18